MSLIEPKVLSMKSRLAKEKLIALVKERSILYDLRHPHNDNRDIKLMAWREIAEVMGSGNAVYWSLKWKNMKDYYKRHVKNNDKKHKSRPSWTDQMNFVDVYLKPTEYISSKKQISQEINQSGIRTENVILYQLVNPSNIITAENNYISQTTSQQINPSNLKTNNNILYQVINPSNLITENNFSNPTTLKGINQINIRPKIHVPNQDTSQNNINQDSSQSTHFNTEKSFMDEFSDDHEVLQNDPFSEITQINGPDLECLKTKKELDDVDHLFLSYAESLKKLPNRTQIMLKLKIATLFSRTELDQESGSSVSIQ